MVIPSGSYDRDLPDAGLAKLQLVDHAPEMVTRDTSPMNRFNNCERQVALNCCVAGFCMNVRTRLMANIVTAESSRTAEYGSHVHAAATIS